MEDPHGIVFLRNEGKTHHEIAHITRFSRCDIQSTINTYRETSSVIYKLRNERPKKLSNKDGQYLNMMSFRNRKKTSVELKTKQEHRGWTTGKNSQR